MILCAPRRKFCIVLCLGYNHFNVVLPGNLCQDIEYLSMHYWQFVSRDWVCVNALLKMSLQMILAIPIIALTFAYLATSYDSILSTPIRPAICTGVLLKIILALPISTTVWNNWHILWIMIISHTHMTVTSIKGNTHTFALATPMYQSLI